MILFSQKTISYTGCSTAYQKETLTSPLCKPFQWTPISI